MYKVKDDGVFYDFGIACYYDIWRNINDIYNKIKPPSEKPKSVGYVFDEDRSVKWNREQVELYNNDLAAEREEAYRVRRESLSNLDDAVIEYMHEYEAKSDTPIEVLRTVLTYARMAHEDEYWNYLGQYLEFAEAVIEAAKDI